MLLDLPYLRLLQTILEEGEKRGDRTGTGTISLFGCQMEFDISERIPLLTTKRVHWPSVLGELLWFLSGSTNVNDMNGVRIWNEWADENGELGPVYGKQWRRWDTIAELTDPFTGEDSLYQGRPIDQIADVIQRIKDKPEDRRLIVSAWNVAGVPNMALPPCHLLFQFYVRRGKYLDCKLYQRSADMFLGVPFNIASYSTLIYMVSQVTGLLPGRFIWSGGDCHIYSNHIEQVETQLNRTPRLSPRLELDRGVTDIDDFKLEHFHLFDYEPDSPIRARVAV